MIVVALSVWFDIRFRRVPNFVTYPGFACALLLGAATSGFDGLIVSLAGATIAAVLFLLPVLKGGIAMGDLKLVMALGALGGPSFALWMSLCTMVAGGVVAIIIVARSGVSGSISAEKQAAPIPYAVPIALGSIPALIVARPWSI